MPRVKLTDKQKKKIIADYTNNQNKSETARMNNVSEYTVRAIVKNCDEELSRKIEQKKEDNTKDILDYMDSIVEDQKEVIKLSMEAMKKKLKSPDVFTSVKDIATVYGVIFDKALKSKEIRLKANGGEEKIQRVQIINDLPIGDVDEIK